MANIAIRKNGPTATTTTPATSSEWDPGQWMRSMLSWDPFREMMPYLREEPIAFTPAFEIKETKDGYEFRADVPGVKQDDIEVTLTHNRLSISGKREADKQDKTDKYYTYERSYGSFMRSFTLPEGVDANGVRADLKDGVLTVSVAKKPEAQPKKIEVKAPPGAPKS